MNYEVNFPFYVLLHKLHKPMSPPLPSPSALSLRPFLRPYLKPSPTTLKIPPSRAWRRLHHANAVNFQPSGSGDAGILKNGTTQIVAGLYIGRPPTTSFAGMNLASANIAHPLPNCRLFYSQVTVDPQKSIDYVQRNRTKK